MGPCVHFVTRYNQDETNCSDKMNDNDYWDGITEAQLDPYMIAWFVYETKSGKNIEDCFVNFSNIKNYGVYRCNQDSDEGRGEKVNLGNLRHVKKRYDDYGGNWSQDVEKTQTRPIPTSSQYCLTNPDNVSVSGHNSNYPWIGGELARKGYNCPGWYEYEGKTEMINYFKKNVNRYIDKEKPDYHKAMDYFKYTDKNNDIWTDEYSKLYCDGLDPENKTINGKIRNEDGFPDRFTPCIDQYNRVTDEQKKKIFNPILKKWCLKKENLVGPFCRTFAMAEPTAQGYRGEFDNAWTSYCKEEENKTTDVCACFDEDERYAKQAFCFHPTCTNIGYKTLNMEGTDCASLCQNIVDLKAGGDIIYDNVEVKNMCKSQYDIDIDIKEPPKSTKDETTKQTIVEKDIDNRPDTSDDDDDNDNNTNTYIIIGIIGFLLLLLVLFFLFRKRKRGRVPHPGQRGFIGPMPPPRPGRYQRFINKYRR